MPQEQTPTQVSPQEFAAKVKAKYPVYANVPDDQLVEKITAKYPQYKSQIKQAAAAPKQNQWDNAQKPGQPFNLETYLNSPQAKKIQGDTANTVMGSAGAKGLFDGAKALFSPSTITKAGPLVPGGRDPATGRMLPWIASKIEAEGPSAARKMASGAVSGAKGVASWLKANPWKAAGIEAIAHQLGVDPMQIAQKMLKYGPSLASGGTAVP